MCVCVRVRACLRSCLQRKFEVRVSVNEDDLKTRARRNLSGIIRVREQGKKKYSFRLSRKNQNTPPQSTTSKPPAEIINMPFLLQSPMTTSSSSAPSLNQQLRAGCARIRASEFNGSSSSSSSRFITTFSNNRRRRRKRERGRTIALGSAANAANTKINEEKHSAAFEVFQIDEQKQQQQRALPVATLRREALGQLSASTELSGKKIAGFIAVPSHAQANSRSFIAEYCRNISHGSQAAYSFGGLLLAASLVKIKNVLDTPSRTYVEGENTVGNEYDAWTKEEILEYYWGEHIHLGYYNDEDLAKGAGTLLGHKVKDFIEAKEDFVDEMFKFSKAEKSKITSVLDVGCGIGGASRRLASECIGGGAQVTGITLSPEQAKRANDLAKSQNIPNAKFEVMDALNMSFADNSFDLVWACESGEHMPDKKKYVEEMMRVLKPGGTLVLATWCQRETPPALTKVEKSQLQFLYDEWAHPYFISIEEYGRLVEACNPGATVTLDDWTKQTIVSWRHSIWAGVYDPLPVFTRPKIWYKTLRDIICLERMQRAFKRKLMVYGMMRVVKK